MSSFFSGGVALELAGALAGGSKVNQVLDLTYDFIIYNISGMDCLSNPDICFKRVVDSSPFDLKHISTEAIPIAAAVWLPGPGTVGTGGLERALVKPLAASASY